VQPDLLAVHVKLRRGFAGSTDMSQISAFRKLLKKLHRDERGAVSLETILIIGAIALPILIFVIKYGWPRIRDYFFKGMSDLQNNSDRVTQGQ
jgi:hypothetical protein